MVYLRLILEMMYLIFFSPMIYMIARRCCSRPPSLHRHEDREATPGEDAGQAEAVHRGIRPL